MPRKIRCIIPNLPHHALQRGNNRQNIFLDSIDKYFFLKQLNKYGYENKVGIGAYCIMTNHFHLLIYPEQEEGVIKLMKSISQIYAQYFNRKYKRSGKIWENRYKLNIVEPECQWVFARYIENNPIRAGVVLKAETYLYSSAAANLKGQADEILTRNIINDKREEYIKFFKESEADNDKPLNLLRTVIQQQKAFGGKEFIRKLKEKFQVNFEIKPRGRPRKG